MAPTPFVWGAGAFSIQASAAPASDITFAYFLIN
jgi:hypothetical protein